MRLLAAILITLSVGFLAVMGYFYVRDGSMESAGASVDEGLQRVDQTTEPLQEGIGELGEGIKETVENAMDGNDGT